MSVKEVTNLRKSGKLTEAVSMAREELANDYNEWTCMSLFWSLRDYTQNVLLPNGETDKALAAIKEMKELLPDMMDNNGIGKVAFGKLQKSILPHGPLLKEATERSKNNPIEAYETLASQIGPAGNGLKTSLHEEYGWIIYRYLKAKQNELDSLQIRGLLRDYMLLKNERPSLLHSTFLNYAIAFSKGHIDFSFYRFFRLWGVNNLRAEDYEEHMLNGQPIPSLVSRICRTIVESGETFDVREFVDQFKTKGEMVVDALRQSFFWMLMSCHKEDKEKNILPARFDSYAERYSSLGPSYWHSEILKLACRVFDDSSNRFFSFMRKWYGNGNFRDEDYRNEKGNDGKEYPALATKATKKCFEYVKNSNPKEPELLTWLQSVYSTLLPHAQEDDWNARNYAILCLWRNEKDEALTVYKKLLANMGQKYYLWAEAAECITDNPLRIGLLQKAKSLEKNEDFLGDIHLKLAQAWITEGAGKNARLELEQYAKHRKEKEWGVSDFYHSLHLFLHKAEDSWKDPEPYIAQAEAFAYSDYACHDCVMTDRWSHNKTEYCHFCDDNGLSFLAKRKNFKQLYKARPGDIYEIRCKTEQGIVTPLTFRKKEVAPWSILKEKYGVIDYVNKAKQVLHIITEDSKQVFCPIGEKQPEANGFVRFREYTKMRKEAIETHVAEVTPCPKEEALPHMPGRIVVVDDVNESKQLFHIVLGEGMISDVIHFNQTELRPEVGDFLRIVFCIKKNKEGKKFLKILDIQPSEKQQEGLRRVISGTLSVRFKNDVEGLEPDFAFIDDFYVHRNLLKKHNILTDCRVVAHIVLSGNDKWKVYRLSPVPEE